MKQIIFLLIFTILLNAQDSYNKKTIGQLKSDEVLNNLFIKLNKNFPLTINGLRIEKALVSKDKITYLYTILEEEKYLFKSKKKFIIDKCMPIHNRRLMNAGFLLEYIYNEKDGTKKYQFNINKKDCNTIIQNKILLMNKGLPKKLGKSAVAEKNILKENNIVYKIRLKNDKLIEKKGFYKKLKKSICSDSSFNLILDGFNLVHYYIDGNNTFVHEYIFNKDKCLEN